jgi:membrane-bound ClpP family serine protease
MAASPKNSWNDILEEIQSLRGPDSIRRRYLRALHEHTGRNVISYVSGWLQKGATGIQVNEFAITDADKNGFMSTVHRLDPSRGLDLLLHTPGGSIGATESIVDYLHSVFGTNLRVIVPQIAMSAGTLLALAARSIVMGKQSSLGPTDPQLNGAPAGAILDSLTAAYHDMTQNPGAASVWHPILARYTPHLIIEARQAIKWSQELATAWLERGMFHSDLGENPDAAKSVVEKIVSHLSTHNQTLSHDRHISLDR